MTTLPSNQASDIFSSHNVRSVAEPVLMFAPLDGISTPLVRELICQIGGVDLVATEFIRITNARQQIEPIVRHSVPLQIQFMAADPRDLAACLHYQQDRGLISSKDWIDLNVGCPSRRVTSRGAGAGLLKTPTKIRMLIDALREVHPGPLSLKTRIGFNSSADFDALLSCLATCPIDFVTIHARSSADQYSGLVRQDLISIATQQLPYPVIANGDISDPNDALSILESTKARGVMCGRGALINPFLFADIRAALAGTKTPCTEERQRALATYLTELLSKLVLEEAEISHSLAGPTKELLSWLGRNPLIPQGLFDSIKRLDTLAEITKCVKNILATVSRA